MAYPFYAPILQKIYIAIKILTAFGKNLRPTIKQSTFICDGVFYRPSISYLEIDDALNIETKLQFIISPNHIYSTLYQTLKGNIFHGWCKCVRVGHVYCSFFYKHMFAFRSSSSYRRGYCNIYFQVILCGQFSYIFHSDK